MILLSNGFEKRVQVKKKSQEDPQEDYSGRLLLKRSFYASKIRYLV